MRLILFLAVIAATGLLPGQTVSPPNPPAGVTPERATRVRRLDQQLRSAADKSQQDLTAEVLREIDSLIVDSLDPATVDAGKVKTDLDELLGRNKGDMVHEFAFRADLARGKFLILAVELWRGAGAIPENFVSLRAYKAQGTRYALAAVSNGLRGSDSQSPYLVGLHAAPFPVAPNGEFWICAWAEVPPKSPPTVALRVEAFDGERFRTVWAPEDFVAPGVEDAAHITADGGLVISRMPDWKGSAISNEQYVFSSDGPRKVAQWQTQRQ